MILFIVLSLSALSATYMSQDKYTYCEKIEFEAEYCEIQKKIYESVQDDL